MVVWAVEQAGQGAGHQLAEGVAEQPGLVEELPGRLRSGSRRPGLVGGVVERCHSCGMVTSRSRLWPAV